MPARKRAAKRQPAKVKVEAKKKVKAKAKPPAPVEAPPVEAPPVEAPTELNDSAMQLRLHAAEQLASAILRIGDGPKGLYDDIRCVKIQALEFIG